MQDDEHWRELAACAEIGGDLFFPGKGEPVREAKSVCAGCGVRTECLEYVLSLEFNPPGVWGMTSEIERKRIRRARGIREPAEPGDAA